MDLKRTKSAPVEKTRPTLLAYVVLVIGITPLLAAGLNTQGSPGMPQDSLRVTDSSVPGSTAAGGVQQEPEVTFYDTERRRMLYEMQDDLMSWGKGRFWFITGVIALFGFFGVRAYVRELVAKQLNDATKAAAKAEAAAEQARDSAKRAIGEVDAGTAALEQLQLKGSAVEESFGRLKNDIERSQREIESVTTHAVANADLELKEVGKKVEELSSTVENLTRASATSEALAVQFEAAMEEIRRHAAEERDVFAENAQYSIEITLHPDYSSREAELVRQALTAAGFKVSTGRWSRDTLPSSVIRIDRRHGIPEAIGLVIRDQVVEAYQETGREPPKIEVLSRDLDWQKRYEKNKIWLFWEDFY